MQKQAATMLWYLRFIKYCCSSLNFQSTSFSSSVLEQQVLYYALFESRCPTAFKAVLTRSSWINLGLQYLIQVFIRAVHPISLKCREKLIQPVNSYLHTDLVASWAFSWNPAVPYSSAQEGKKKSYSLGTLPIKCLCQNLRFFFRVGC